MAELVYILCGLTSIACAILLYRQYRFTKGRLLFWSTCCFLSLAVTNVLLYLDLVVFPNIDLSTVRNAITLAGMMMLLYGLIREST
jgi:ABC-type iron transport system FetAB permease component